MFKSNIINSGKLAIRLMLVVFGLFILMVLLELLNGGTEAAKLYVESLVLRELFAPVIAFFLVVAIIPPVLVFLVPKLNFRVGLTKKKK
jgi:hypothetical protein